MTACLIESNEQIVTRLAEFGYTKEHAVSMPSLNTVDIKKVVNLVDKFGLYGAARIMGYDVSHYNNLLMAGRLAIENLRTNSPKTILEYATLMKQRLNRPTYEFIMKYSTPLQEVMDKNSFRDYDHDWFSANTMITMYSSNSVYGPKKSKLLNQLG